MRAMALRRAGAGLLEPTRPAVPGPSAGQVLIKVRSCGVCRTDLHVVEGDLPDPKIPLVPGHEIVGIVESIGRDVESVRPGDRVGVPWLGYTCGTCPYCRDGRENLCPEARFTGYHLDGGYAEFTVADARYTFPVPDGYDDAGAAPLLCAGLIGYRAYRLAGPGRRLGLYGFGAAAHILAQVARHDGREVYAFTSPGDGAAQAFARQVGAVWAGDSVVAPPVPLDAAIIFAPVGALVPEALSRVVAGGVVVCAGIHMSPIPSFPYERLWHERTLRSVANLTRQDAREFLVVARATRIRTIVTRYALEDANRALADLAGGRLEGAAVIVP